MRILCVSPTYYPAKQFGGPITALRSLNKYLTKAGAHIEVHTTDAGLSEIKNNLKVESVDGIEVFYHPCSNFLSFLTGTGWNFSISLAISIFKRSKEFNIIYCRSLWNFPTLAAYFASIINHKKLVIASTGKLTAWSFSQKSLKKSLFWNLLFKRIANHAVIHYVSEYEKEISQDNIKIFHNGIVINTGTEKTESANRISNIKFSFNELSSKNPKLFFLGRIHKMKGILKLIQTFNIVLKTHPHASLILSGPFEGSYHKECFSLLESLSMPFKVINFNEIPKIDFRGQVIFTELINDDEANWLFQNTDIYCQFSENEGFSNSIIEAICFGKPIFLTSGCYFKESGSDDFVFLIRNSSDAGKRISSLLNEPSQLTAISEKAQNFSKNYSWDNIAIRALKDFSEIIT